jgi:uncharacterized membrane protein
MRTAWVVMAFLAIVVASYALGGIVAPSARSSFLADLFARAPLPTLLHLACGSVALIVGAFQVDRRIRHKFPRLHRWFGAGYIISVVVGGTAALALAPSSFGGLVTHLGFGGLAVCWVVTTILALRSIRRREIPAHQRWMYRSYALTLAAVTLRIYLPLAAVAGFQFDDAYRVVSWMCWVPNLLIAETWVVPRAGPHAIRA